MVLFCFNKYNCPEYLTENCAAYHKYDHIKANHERRLQVGECEKINYIGIDKIVNKKFIEKGGKNYGRKNK